MATKVGFLDASAGSPSYAGADIRGLLSLVAGVAPSGRGLGATSGVRPGTLTTTAFLSGGSNQTWNVSAHGGVIDAETSLTAGPYLYSTDGTDTGTISAANATYARIDILYVQINDSVQDGSGLESGQVLYLAGTAGPSPSAPSPSVSPSSRALVLAQINVPAVGGGNPTITWVAPVAGGPQASTSSASWIQGALRIQVWSSAVANVAAGGTLNSTVSFPQAFSQTPIAVFATTATGRYTVATSSYTTTNFNLNVGNWSSGAPGTATGIVYLAIGTA